MSHTLQPVLRNERIQLLDILRGFAIFGIFIMNLRDFSFYWAFTPEQKLQTVFSSYDSATGFLHRMFFEGKFYSIFSMLFGIGFAIYLSKSDENKEVLPVFKRRLAILLLIGLTHLMLWSGDIVMFYAMLGFVLIPFRKFNNKTLLIIAGCCILSPIGWYALKMSNPEIFDLSRYVKNIGTKMDANIGIVTNQDYYKIASGDNALKILRANVDGIFFRYSELLFQSRAFKVLGMFLVGLVIGRTKFFNKLNQNRKLLWMILICGLVIGLPCNYIMAKLMAGPGYYQLTINGLKQTIVYAFGVAPLALAYASGFALMYLSNPLRRFLNTLAPVGKMALTNYISHTLIGLFVFTRLGWGIQNMGPAAWTLFALSVYITQIIISTVWLRFFNYGPLEWLWRSATYGKLQPMLKKRTIDELIPAAEVISNQ